jgi:hypothetical protein
MLNSRGSLCGARTVQCFFNLELISFLINSYFISKSGDKDKVKIAMTKTKFNSQKLEIYTTETKE